MSGKAEGYARHATGRPAQFSDTLRGLQTAMFWAAVHMLLDPAGASWDVYRRGGRWVAVPPHLTEQVRNDPDWTP